MPTFSTLRSSSNNTAGFTLVELIVSISIVSVIMTIVVVNQSRYTESTVLSNTVSSLSLSIREAQVYGISVKAVGTTGNEFSAGYGIEFNKVSGSGSNNAYISFADRVSGSQQYVYESGWSCPIGGTSECLKKTTLENGLVISKICEITSSGVEDCTLGRADVSFMRPETDAHFALFNSAGNPISAVGARGVRIEIMSLSGITRSVIVYTTGQISTQ